MSCGDYYYVLCHTHRRTGERLAVRLQSTSDADATEEAREKWRTLQANANFQVYDPRLQHVRDIELSFE